ncbi:MAG: type II secretion system protein, partial [Acidimicrobiales bacterium]
MIQGIARSINKKRAGESGFTLIELLVVIVILGILAAVVVFAVGGTGDKGRTAAEKIDVRTLKT